MTTLDDGLATLHADDVGVVLFGWRGRDKNEASFMVVTADEEMTLDQALFGNVGMHWHPMGPSVTQILLSGTLRIIARVLRPRSWISGWLKRIYFSLGGFDRS